MSLVGRVRGAGNGGVNRVRNSKTYITFVAHSSTSTKQKKPSSSSSRLPVVTRAIQSTDGVFPVSTVIYKTFGDTVLAWENTNTTLISILRRAVLRLDRSRIWRRVSRTGEEKTKRVIVAAAAAAPAFYEMNYGFRTKRLCRTVFYLFFIFFIKKYRRYPYEKCNLCAPAKRPYRRGNLVRKLFRKTHTFHAGFIEIFIVFLGRPC